MQLLLNDGAPVFLAQLGRGLLAAARSHGYHDVEVVAADAQTAKLLAQLVQHLEEGGAAVGLLVEVGPQTQQNALQFAGIKLVLVGLLLQNAAKQLVELRLVQRFLVVSRGFFLARFLADAGAYVFQKLEFVAGVDEDGAGGLAAADAQHEFAHALETAHQRRVVAVAGHDAEAVDQRIGVSHFQRVDHQQDVRVVFLADAVAQAGHHRKGVGKKHFFQVAVAVGVAVYLAQQDIAANLHLFQHVQQGRDFCAGFPGLQTGRIWKR